MARTLRRRIRRLGQVGLALALSLALLPLVEPAVLWLASSDRVVGALTAVAYPSPQAARSQRSAPPRAEIDGRRAVAEVAPEYLSVAIDTSQLVGGHFWSPDARVELKLGQTEVDPFDFDRDRLRRLAQALAPAYLRLGGTEADAVFYAMDDAAARRPPPGYDLVLTRGQWDAVNRFAHDAGLSLMFTVNAGPGSRDARGAFRGDNAEALLAYSKRRGYAVPVWELGNEVNVFWFTQGLDHHLSARRYAADYATFKRLVAGYYPRARVAAAGAFLWPVIGEPPPRFVRDFAGQLGDSLDVLTWHYYPQQSRRCWSATRRAVPGAMLEPAHLDELARHAAYVEGIRDAEAPRAEVWLGETGGAQCGGEPGISDRFESSLWWLDELGQLARRGQRVVVRQTLAGSDYGLLDAETLSPRPDYWASLLWKRVMGPKVLEVRRSDRDGRLRSYAHCAKQGPPGSVALLLINTEREAGGTFELAGLSTEAASRYRVTAASLDASEVALNGQPLRLVDRAGEGVGDGLPDLSALAEPAAAFALPAASYAFFVLPKADAPACR